MVDRTRARARGRSRWRGFGLVGDRLWYRAPSGRSRRPGLRFEPDALVVVEPGGTEHPLSWDDGETPGEGRAHPAWSLHALPRGRGTRVAFRLSLASSAVGGQPGRTAPRHLRLASGIRPPSDALPALCRYLAATPAARAGLADPVRIRALLGDLASSSWRRPEPPHEPLAGERLDLHRGVVAALGEMEWRLIDHRPVAGEPRPVADEVVPAVRAALPEEVASRVSDQRVRDEVERHLAVGAWPFEALTDRPG